MYVILHIRIVMNPSAVFLRLLFRKCKLEQVEKNNKNRLKLYMRPSNKSHSFSKYSFVWRLLENDIKVTLAH